MRSRIYYIKNGLINYQCCAARGIERDLDTDTDSPSETTARVTDPWIMIIRRRQIDRKLSTFRHILSPLPFFSIHAYTFSTYILSFGQIGSQHEYEVKRGICRLSSIYVQVDSMGFYFQQTRFQMPGSPYRRGKVCRSNVSQAGYDTERVQWVHLLGWNSWMARGTRVSRKKGRKEGRKRRRVIRFHLRGCLYLLKIVLLSFHLFTIPVLPLESSPWIFPPPIPSSISLFVLEERGINQEISFLPENLLAELLFNRGWKK